MEAHNNHHTNSREAVQENVLQQARSEEVQEIMGRMPSWILRWGITIIALLLLLLLAGAALFRYPDVIPAVVHISSANPPVTIQAQNSGRISHLLVSDKQDVLQGMPVAVIENAAVYEDVQQLKRYVQLLDTATDLLPVLQMNRLQGHLQVGMLQPAYTGLFQASEAYLFFVTTHYDLEKVAHLQAQVKGYGALSDELSKKEQPLQEQLKLERGSAEIDSTLVADKVITAAEYRNARQRYLNQLINTEGNRSNQIQNQLQQAEYRKNISETMQQHFSKRFELEQQVRDAIKQLTAALADWEQRYVLKSPVAGKVSFFSVWAINQWVRQGENIAMVVPPVQQYIAKGTLPLFKAGKVKAGQEVLVKLNTYPYEEYGMLKGRVAHVSPVAMDTAFALDITLDSNLVTNAGIQIPRQAQLSGIGEILTEDKSVLLRLFERFYGRWRR